MPPHRTLCWEERPAITCCLYLGTETDNVKTQQVNIRIVVLIYLHCLTLGQHFYVVIPLSEPVVYETLRTISTEVWHSTPNVYPARNFSRVILTVTSLLLGSR